MTDLRLLLKPLLLLICLGAGHSGWAQARRVVVIKVDGLSSAVIDRYATQKDPRTGKSRLPWIDHLFYQRGSRLENFYCRGLSLSAPSWSVLITGQHQQVKGNVEFDRFLLYDYDYLGYIPFYLNNARKVRVDSPGVEVLDDLGIPLLTDYFPHESQYPSFHLFQRGVRWSTFKNVPLNWAKSRTPSEVFSEWMSGFEIQNLFRGEYERVMMAMLNEPGIRYLDYGTEEFDHVVHRMREASSHYAALKKIDEMIGRFWSAIQRSPLARETVLMVVSDHGSNTDEKVYSQGFSLLDLLGKAEGGGHHVVTRRHSLSAYRISSLYPFSSMIVNRSAQPLLPNDKGEDYPTAALDFDGNERASLHLRDSDLNILPLLLGELAGKRLAPEVRRAATAAFLEVLNRKRTNWQRTVAELEEELAALREAIRKERELFATETLAWKPGVSRPGKDKEILRRKARADVWEEFETGYRSHIASLKKLLSLQAEDFESGRRRDSVLIPPRSMGDSNTIHQLQNYVVGVAEGGLSLHGDGALDMEKSFRRLDYFSLFARQTVRNNVQRGVSSRPIDFVAVRLPLEGLAGTLTAEEMPHEDAVWLYGDEEKQALILPRRGEKGVLQLRYLPVSHLTQSDSGEVRFQRAAWQPGLPLRLFEDPALAVPGEIRESWLSAWHSEDEWLEAAHKTDYSNAVIGLHEHFCRHQEEAAGVGQGEASGSLMRRFQLRRRRLVEPDFLLLANRHWNFDVRGFNPGGNHGSFFRASTLSTLMAVGGEETGIRDRNVIRQPYDGLSFTPTVLAIMGQNKSLDSPSAADQNGATRLPGRVIKEIFQKRDGQVANSRP